MRGGLRFGSGRPGWKGKVESLRSIDVRQLAHSRRLKAGDRFLCSWTDEGKLSGFMGVRVHDEFSLSLEYHYHTDNGPKKCSHLIRLEYTPCRFGGRRVWFTCPQTGRRAAKLYAVNGRWFCRQALRLAYFSQSEDIVARMWRRKRKIEARLDEDMEKPKGMHWATYDRLIDKWNDAEARLDYAFYLFSCRFLRRCQL